MTFVVQGLDIFFFFCGSFCCVIESCGDCIMAYTYISIKKVVNVSVYTVAGMHIIFTKRYHWYGPSVEKKSTVWKIFLSLCLSFDSANCPEKREKMRRLYMVFGARVKFFGGLEGDCGWKDGGSW